MRHSLQGADVRLARRRRRVVVSSKSAARRTALHVACAHALYVNVEEWDVLSFYSYRDCPLARASVPTTACSELMKKPAIAKTQTSQVLPVVGLNGRVGSEMRCAP